jgi:hypothetical protein
MSIPENRVILDNDKRYFTIKIPVEYKGQFEKGIIYSIYGDKDLGDLVVMGNEEYLKL